jgi:hypothetical protein
MSIHSFLTMVQDLPLSAAVRGDVSGWATWLFPIVETCHILALSLVFGSIALLDMRLLGWRSLSNPVSKLARATLPVTWTAWGFAAVFGSILFMSKATTYAGNLQFQLKFVMMGLAAVNMLVFHFGPYRQVATWDTASKPPGAARLAGALSLALWTAVIFFGRWTGFTT